MRLWTNGSLHVQLAPAVRPRTPASLRVFEDGRLLRATPAGGASVDVDIEARRIVVCRHGAISSKPSAVVSYDLESLERLESAEIAGLRAVATLGTRRVLLMRDTLAFAQPGEDMVVRGLSVGGETRDVRTGATSREDAASMHTPLLSHTPWGLALGDGPTGRAALVRGDDLVPLPWRFPATSDTELDVRATESGHLVAARRAGRDSTFWHVTADRAQRLLDGVGGWACGVGDDVGIIVCEERASAFRLSTGEELDRIGGCAGAIAGAAAAGGCMVLGTATGLLEVRWDGTALTTRTTVVVRRFDVVGSFATEPDAAALMKGLANSSGASASADGVVFVLEDLDAESVEEAKARMLGAGASAVEVRDAC